MSVAFEDRSCTETCKSTVHGDVISAALTKRGVSSAELCAFLKNTCCCCDSVRDSRGRTALHVAASCGRLEIVKWLLRRQKCSSVNARDWESCYSALHRSVFYGKIDVAVTLLKFGASISQTDADGLTVLEHVMKDQKHVNYPNDGEIYVWGSNTNYTLGPQQARSVPELMDIFHKENPQISVKQICLSKFHCVIVTTDGRVFSCGHGQGGRLGLAAEHSVLVPKVVKFSSSGYSVPVVCTQASIAQDHSVFLTGSGHVWTCGLNTHRVLGLHPPPLQLLVPRPTTPFQHPIKGVCAVRYHTVAWGPRAIYTWGLHAGQLGHDRSDQTYITTPKLIPVFWSPDADLKALASSIGAITCATTKGDIYVLHEYQCRKIAARQLNVVDLSVVGGTLDVSESVSWEKRRLEVLARTDNGNLLLWQENDPQLSRCVFSLNRVVVVRQAMLNASRVLFVTTDGEAFEGEVRERKQRKVVDGGSQGVKSAFHKFLERDDCRFVKASKLPRIHRAISIESDLKGKNFAVLQTSPRYFLTNIPETSTSTFQNDLRTFFENIDKTDHIHDVTFKINNRTFPAHRYMVALKSSKLNDLMSQENSRVVELSDVHPEIFHQMLRFIYTGDCDMLKCGVCLVQIGDENANGVVTKIREPNCEPINGRNVSAFEHYKTKKSKPESVKISKPKDPLRLLNECAKKYDVVSLNNSLNGYTFQNGLIKKQGGSFSSQRTVAKFTKLQFPELYDVKIKTKNGKEIMAHKCVLVARMEYFNNMFSLRWNNDPSTMQEISLPFSFTVVEHLLEYLYTDSLPSIEKEDTELICNLLVVADQFFVTRLKELCECILSTTITLKNITQIFSFASVYNAQQLKACCMEFICLNLAALLESGALNDVDDYVLTELARFYCDWNPSMCQRVVTPYSTAPSDEEVTNIAQSAPFSAETESKSVQKASAKKRSRNHRHSRTSESEKEAFVEVCIEPRLQFEPEETPETSPVPVRLRAIASAAKRVQSEVIVSEYTKLGAGDFHGGDFPQLGSPPAPHRVVFAEKSPKAEKAEGKSRFSQQKLSQKQRKRLSSEGSVKELPLAESPKNPWKVGLEVTSPVESPECKIDAIISSEKKQKENFSKMLSKSLVNTQKEDKAIEDLYKFYNVQSMFDEIISIERVRVDLVGPPVWVQKVKH